MRFVLVATTLVVALCLTPGLSFAQAFGNYATAVPVAPGENLAGAYFTVADDILGALGHYRFGYSNLADFGFQIGFNSMDDRVYQGGMFREEGETHLLIGGDTKYALRRADEGMPVDVSVDFGAGYVDRDDGNQLLFSMGAQGSWSVETADANTLSPYVGIAVVLDRVTIDAPGDDITETDTDFQARIGAQYYLSESASAVAEIQTGGGTTFGIGLNLRF